MRHILELVSSFVRGEREPTFPLTDHDCEDPDDEFHPLFARANARLLRVQRELKGSGASVLRMSVVVLFLFWWLADHFRALVKKQKTQKLLVRFAIKRRSLEALQEIHGDIDQLFTLLKLTHEPEMSEWRRHWASDRQAMHAAFAARVVHPRLAIAGLPQAQIVEALAVLKYEMDYHKDGNTPEQLQLMRRTFMEVVKCSKARVPRIPEFFIPFLDLELQTPNHSVVGVSTNCAVTSCTWDRDTRLAVQYLQTDAHFSEQLFLRATEVWHGLDHPNLVKMLGASHVHSPAVVVWEDAAAYGNFLSYFASGCDQHECHQLQLWRKFLQAARGLNHMHSQGLTHGSLKCTHILVSTDETARICDLGLNFGPEHGEFNRWKSPEANNGSGADPSKPGDVYAFGLCIIEARTGAIPYDIDSDDLVENRLRQGEAYPRPDGMRDDEWDVVKQLCALKPEDRPTMEQAIEMLSKLAAREEQEERADAKDKLEE